MKTESILASLLREHHLAVSRHGISYILAEGEDGGTFYAWEVPADEETPAVHRFLSDFEVDDYGELAEEIAEWLDEPEPWRSRLARLLARLTGGRPMVDEGKAFTDVVSGESVHYYRDRLGRDWLATSRWAMFRVPRRGSGFNLDERLWGWKRDR